MPDNEVVAQVAVSLDLYIAEDDGGVDFLEKHSVADYDFDAFSETIGGLVIGSTTYVQAVGFGWVWDDLPTLVLTSRDDLPTPDGADVRFAAMPTPEAIRSFSAETPKRLWVMGGGRVISEGLAGGAIDTLDLMVMPEVLGSGIPLFAEPYDGPMRLVTTEHYEGDAVRVVYETSDRD